jgi:hypothetical protein
MKYVTMAMGVASIAIASLLFFGCMAREDYGISQGTGFYELKYPRGGVMPGQIVEIHTNPYETMETCYSPNIPLNDIIEVNSASVMCNVEGKSKAAISAKIKTYIDLNIGHGSEYLVKTSLINAKILQCDKSFIDQFVSELLLAPLNAKKKQYIIMQQERGIHLDLITQVLVGQFSVDIIDKSGTKVALSSEELKKLSIDAGIDFQLSDVHNTKITTEKPMAIAILYDSGWVKWRVK